MGKGAKGGGNKKSRRLEELQAALEAAPEPEASAESKPGPQTEEEKRAAEETEAQFMAALAREIGVPQEELTDEAVRAAMAKLSPAQLQKLAEEGKALKAELHSRPDDYSDEIEVFRDELNKRAEASDLPVEKDGEHLGKKIVAYMEGSSEPMPYLVLLEAVASTPYLVKLALAEAREKAAVADRADLDAIESELARLKVPGWRASDPEREGRPPFVRRNLLLVYFHMYASAIRALELDNGTKRACGEIMGKVARLLDMLFQYSLKNRWIKAALTITELQVTDAQFSAQFGAIFGGVGKFRVAHHHLLRHHLLLRDRHAHHALLLHLPGADHQRPVVAHRGRVPRADEAAAGRGGAQGAQALLDGGGARRAARRDRLD